MNSVRGALVTGSAPVTGGHSVWGAPVTGGAVEELQLIFQLSPSLEPTPAASSESGGFPLQSCAHHTALSCAHATLLSASCALDN